MVSILPQQKGQDRKMIDLTMRLCAYFEQDHNFAEYQKIV